MKSCSLSKEGKGDGARGPVPRWKERSLRRAGLRLGNASLVVPIDAAVVALNAQKGAGLLGGLNLRSGGGKSGDGDEHAKDSSCRLTHDVSPGNPALRPSEGYDLDKSTYGANS